MVGLSTLSGTHMRTRYVLLHQSDLLNEALPLTSPWHEPTYLPPTTSETLATPRDQRIPAEVSSNLKDLYRPVQYPGKKARVLRRVTICLISQPMEISAPGYADWEARASLFVAINILTDNVGIRHLDSRVK